MKKTQQKFSKQINKGLVTEHEVAKHTPEEIAGIIRKRKAQGNIRDFLAQGARCFYTGLPLRQTDQDTPLQITAEHLVSQSYTKKIIPHNIVPAAAFVNSRIGNPPLKIKYKLKARFENFRKWVDVNFDTIVDRNNPQRNSTINRAVGTAKEIIIEFLNDYRINGAGSYCWQWWNLDDRYSKDREILKQMWIDNLTTEEMQLMIKFPGGTARKYRIAESFRQLTFDF